MSATPAPLARVLREMAPSVYVPSFLSAIAQNAIDILLPLYALEVGGGPALAAAMLGLRGTGTMLVDVPAGLLVSRFGDRSVMLGGLGLLVLTGAVCAASDAPWVIAAMALLFGVALGLWLLGRLTYITDRVALGQRGRVISVMAGLQRAGALIGPLGAGVGVQAFGYRAVFAVAALLFASSLGALLLSGRLARATRHVPAPPLHLRAVLREQRGVFARVGSVMVALQVLRAGRRLMIPVWGAAIGLDAAWIGTAFSVSSAIDMLMFYPAGLLLDHVGRKWALGPSMVLLALALALLPLTRTLPLFLGVCALMGLGNGFGTGIFMTLGGDFSPPRGRSEFLGVWRLIGDVGSAAGPFWIGALAELWTVGAACAATAGLGLLGLLALLWLVPEPLRIGRTALDPTATRRE